MGPIITIDQLRGLFPLKKAHITHGEEIRYVSYADVEEFIVPLTMDSKHTQASTVFSFTIPKPDDGIFEINGTDKIIINVGRPNFEYSDEGSNTFENLRILSYKEVLQRR